jgi:hypothetical protein
MTAACLALFLAPAVLPPPREGGGPLPPSAPPPPGAPPPGEAPVVPEAPPEAVPIPEPAALALLAGAASSYGLWRLLRKGVGRG